MNLLCWASSEHNLKNKDVAGVAFNYVDDPRVYRFLEEVHGLPNNNPITAFGTAQDICDFLREQWAGMFQRFLQSQERQREVHILKDLQANMQTLNELVTYLTQEKQSSDAAIREILRANHPIFAQLRKVLRVGYRVFFTTRAELSEWLKVRDYAPLDRTQWDDPKYEKWTKGSSVEASMLLKISAHVFDAKGDLVIFTAQQWHSEWVSLTVYQPDPPDEPDTALITDDEAPF